MSNPFTERLNDLKADTDARILAMDITLSPEVGEVIQALQARRAEINNLIQLSLIWSEFPPCSPEEIEEYRQCASQLRQRIRELERNSCAGGKSERIMKQSK